MQKIIQYKFPVPIMIDESIYGLEDIKKAKEIGAKYIKLKLCKFGGLKILEAALDYAKTLGLHVVFGNGVATDIANYYELNFYKKNKNKIFGATESVGFQKIKKSLKFNITTD